MPGGAWASLPLAVYATMSTAIPSIDRTTYGYHLACLPSLLPHDVQQQLGELRYHVAADRLSTFSVLIDVRGATGCSAWTTTLLTDALVWLHAHGMRRSAVLFDHASIFLHVRAAAQTACVYGMQRYFNVKHVPNWLAEADAWLSDGAEQHTSRRGEHLTELSVLLDGLSEGVMVCASPDQVLVENSALSRLLAREIEGDDVRSAMLTFATERIQLRDTVGHGGALVDHASTIVRTTTRTYRIRCTSSVGGWFGTPDGIMVSLEPMMSAPLDDVEVQSRFGLTNRELSVARLVAIGKTNVEIATLLKISTYTARNHVERILSKLRVRNRASVSAVLLADVVPSTYFNDALALPAWTTRRALPADVAVSGV